MKINEILTSEELENLVVVEAGGSAYIGVLVDNIEDEVLKKVATPTSIVLKYPIKLMLTFQGGIGTSVLLNNLSDTPSQRTPFVVINTAGFAIGRPTESLKNEYRKLVASQFFGIDIKQEQIIVPPDAKK